MSGQSASKQAFFRWLTLLAAALSLFFAGMPAAAAASGNGEVKADSLEMTAPAADKQALAFSKATESLYQSIRQGERLEATRALQETEQIFRRLPLGRIPTSEGIESLAASVSEMKRAWAAVTPNEDRIERAAGALRMAADALAHPSKPMWHQYRSVLNQDADALAQAIENQQSPKSALDSLTKHYGIIRTAAALQVEPSAIERMDSVLRYSNKLLSESEPRKDFMNRLGQQIKDAIAALFPPAGDAPTSVIPLAPPTWGITATIGSFIIMILSWAGWKRFQFDRNHPGRRSEASRNRSDAAKRWFR
ncbi:sporulation protein YpjB [Cohnella sp. AR92]|uniref:sporulation protein YpjB n=1 Tax=Cohnella sp. AR92 TaxID=648716 RepID=UPI000F8D52E5|nr:sporulation protein YpjB [Cohnella sp. AR92]RUS48198.1 hypothetical protein ELR57_06635 [Cohnella sp. AR92]